MKIIKNTTYNIYNLYRKIVGLQLPTYFDAKVLIKIWCLEIKIYLLYDDFQNIFEQFYKKKQQKMGWKQGFVWIFLKPKNVSQMMENQISLRCALKTFANSFYGARPFSLARAR